MALQPAGSPSHLLSQQLSAAIEEALADIENPGPFDKQVWPDVHAEIVRPLVCNMRDVRRYAIAIRETVAGLDGEVALADALGLEAVRLFLPDVFRHLPSAIDGLTVTSRAAERRLFTMTQEDPSDPMPGFNKWLKAQIDRLISAVQNDPESETDRTGGGGRSHDRPSLSRWRPSATNERRRFRALRER